MDKLAKLLQKITKKERQAIKSLIVLLKRKQFTGLDIVKIKSSDYYRLRKGWFRIIFYFDHINRIVIKKVQIRSEKTYKHL